MSSSSEESSSSDDDYGVTSNYFMRTERNSIRVRRIPNDYNQIRDFLREKFPVHVSKTKKVFSPTVDDKPDLYPERIRNKMKREGKSGSLYLGWNITLSGDDGEETIVLERLTKNFVQCCNLQYNCNVKHSGATKCCTGISSCVCTTDALESYIIFRGNCSPKTRDAFIDLCDGVFLQVVYQRYHYYPFYSKFQSDKFRHLPSEDVPADKPCRATTSLRSEEPISLTADCTAEQEIETNKSIIHLTSVITDLSVRNNELLERLTMFEEEKEEALATITEELETTKKRKEYHKAKSQKKQQKIQELLIEVEKQKRKLQKWEKWHSSVLNDD